MDLEELRLKQEALDSALQLLSRYRIPLSRLEIKTNRFDPRGGYGIVRIGELKATDGSVSRKVAVKELTAHSAADALARIAIRLAREMRVWSMFDHPNVLEFIGFHLSEDLEIAYLVSPYMSKGDMKSYLEKTNPSPPERAKFIQDTLDGLQYLHSLDPPVCHGDLKSANVLVAEPLRGVLCDFGLASIIQEGPTDLSTSTGFKGSVRWCSPEVLHGARRDTRSDVWAWACLALEIMSNQLPYCDAREEITVILRISQNVTPEPKPCPKLSGGLLGLLMACWVQDPAWRPDVHGCARAFPTYWDAAEWKNDFFEVTVPDAKDSLAQSRPLANSPSIPGAGPDSDYSPAFVRPSIQDAPLAGSSSASQEVPFLRPLAATSLSMSHPLATTDSPGVGEPRPVSPAVMPGHLSPQGQDKYSSTSFLPSSSRLSKPITPDSRPLWPSMKNFFNRKTQSHQLIKPSTLSPSPLSGQTKTQYSSPAGEISRRSRDGLTYSSRSTPSPQSQASPQHADPAQVPAEMVPPSERSNARSYFSGDGRDYPTSSIVTSATRGSDHIFAETIPSPAPLSSVFVFSRTDQAQSSTQNTLSQHNPPGSRSSTPPSLPRISHTLPILSSKLILNPKSPSAADAGNDAIRAIVTSPIGDSNPVFAETSFSTVTPGSFVPSLPQGASSPVVPAPPRETFAAVRTQSSEHKFDEAALDREKLELALEPLAKFVIPLHRLKIQTNPNDARGGFGVVRIANLEAEDGSAPEKVAAKVLTSDVANAFPLRVAYRLAREMTVWRQLDHPNVLPFLGYHLSDDLSMAYLVSPYMEDGNVRSYLEKTNPTSAVRAQLTQDTADGLRYLHSLNPPICHGDLKSLNVLVTNERKAMLCDFGLASIMCDQPSGLTTSHDFQGSFRWCSPEVIDGLPRNMRSDIWAWACLAFEIMTGDYPYNDIGQDVAVIGQILQHRTPETRPCDKISVGLLGLLMECWSFQPADRPDAQTCARAFSRCWDAPVWHTNRLKRLPADFEKTPTLQPEVLVDGARLQHPSAEPVQNPHTWRGRPDARNRRLTPILEYEHAGPAANHTHSSPAVLNRVRSTTSSLSLQTPFPAGSIPIGSASSGPSEISHQPRTLSPAALYTTRPTEAFLRRTTTQARNYGVVANRDSSVQSRATGSQVGDEPAQVAGRKDMLRRITLAMQTEDRALLVEICDAASTDAGAVLLAANIRAWIEYGEEAIQLDAVRIWVLALKRGHGAFVRLTSSKGFLQKIRQLYVSERTSSFVRERMRFAIAGAAYLYGHDYPELRLSWAEIKGHGQAFEGIPFDPKDPFFSLPPEPAQAAPNRRPPPPPPPLAMPNPGDRRSWHPPHTNQPFYGPLSSDNPQADHTMYPPMGTPEGMRHFSMSADRSPPDWHSQSPPSALDSSIEIAGSQNRLGRTASVQRSPVKGIPDARGNRRIQSIETHGQEGRLSISVDLGTTMSGVAYGSSRINSGQVQSIIHWPGSSDSTFRKVPTCLLYDQHGRVVAWGLEAKNADPLPGEVKCEWFKLFLEPRTLRDPRTIDPRLPKLPFNKKPMDLIVDYLFHLYEYAEQQITRETGVAAALDNPDVWLTVPETWDVVACGLLREAAIEATLVHRAHSADYKWSDRLHIITKSEAAVVHCAALTDLRRLGPFQNFMICDAGGDTVDLTTYRIIGKLSNLEIAKVCASSRANLGSMSLDFRFRELMRTLLTDHPVHLHPASQRHFMDTFTESVKPIFGEGEGEGHENYVYFNCFDSDDPNDPSIGLVNGELAIPGILLRQQVFDPVVAEVLSLLEYQMRKDRAPIDALLLVGGFSENPYLFKRVQERFRDRIAIVARPHDADTATTRGAALYGLAGRPLVSSVICGKAYFMKATLPAEEIDFAQRPAYTYQNASGSNVCENRIEFIIQKGAILRKGQRVIKSSKLRKYSATPLDRMFPIVLYASDSYKVPRYMDEIQYSELCTWNVDIGELPLFQKHAGEHAGGFYTEFELGIELDSFEVRGVLLQSGDEVSRFTLDSFQD